MTSTPTPRSHWGHCRLLFYHSSYGDALDAHPTRSHRHHDASSMSSHPPNRGSRQVRQDQQRNTHNSLQLQPANTLPDWFSLSIWLDIKTLGLPPLPPTLDTLVAARFPLWRETPPTLQGNDGQSHRGGPQEPQTVTTCPAWGPGRSPEFRPHADADVPRRGRLVDVVDRLKYTPNVLHSWSYNPTFGLFMRLVKRKKRRECGPDEGKRQRQEEGKNTLVAPQ